MNKPTQIKNSEDGFERIVSEQLDAFERREFQLRMEERNERAALLKLPITPNRRQANDDRLDLHRY
jgi:hypothetical protein